MVTLASRIVIEFQDVARFDDSKFKSEVWDLKLFWQWNECGWHIVSERKVLIVVYRSIVFGVFVVFWTSISYA
jgi:hypothetical protein